MNFLTCIDVASKFPGSMAGAYNTAAYGGSFLSGVVFGYVAKIFHSYDLPLILTGRVSEPEKPDDCGLLSADLAAGIRRVKGVKKLGIRLGNLLTAEQGNALWQTPDRQRLKGKRDRALLALLLACGLRRHEAVTLTLDHLQQREEHWAIVDLVGKGGHIRTVPVPDWVRAELDDWLAAAAIDRGKLFRRVNKVGRHGEMG